MDPDVRRSRKSALAGRAAGGSGGEGSPGADIVEPGLLFGEVAQHLLAEVVQQALDSGDVGPEALWVSRCGALIDVQGLPEGLAGIVHAVLGAGEEAQVVERAGYEGQVGVGVSPGQLAADLEGFLEGLTGVVHAALGAGEKAHVV